MRVLGIETSCDETGIAIYDTQEGLLSHELYSQIKRHAEYGGVVPELASRDHIQKILPLIRRALEQANTQPEQLDAIAYTAGPGLIGALLVGASVAQSLAFGWNIPAIAIHHMEGHLLAPMLEAEQPELPFLALLVSGGHTQLVQVNQIGDYELLGESVDDAAGEAFDKTAKLLGLPYPGGPILAKLAEQGRSGEFNFPRPMTDKPGLNFSFSGLKTAAAMAIAEQKSLAGGQLSAQIQADIACAFQEAVVDTLVIKCRRALKQTGLKRLVIAGGVSANLALREALAETMQKIRGQVFYPRAEFCTDNGAMIAYAGAFRFAAGEQATAEFGVRPRWPLTELNLPGAG